MKKEVYRQGDVLIERITKVPEGLKRQEPIDGKIILAYGEATMHHHSISSDSADWWKNEKSDEQFIAVRDSALLVHQEHTTIPLPRGNYRITRQMEYSPKSPQRVAD